MSQAQQESELVSRAKRDPEGAWLTASLGAAVLLLAGHSLVDFPLHLRANFLLFVALLAGMAVTARDLRRTAWKRDTQ